MAMAPLLALGDPEDPMTMGQKLGLFALAILFGFSGHPL